MSPTIDAKPPIPVFDGHNDAAFQLQSFDDERIEAFLAGTASGHIDLPRARAGSFRGGLFAMMLPSPPTPDTKRDPAFRITGTGYEVKLAPPVPSDEALRSCLAQIAGFSKLADQSGGSIRIARTTAEIEGCWRDDALAIVLHLEGAEAIAPDLSTLDTLYDLEFRSLGIVWSRPNTFGHGVPFRFPASPDTGPGLTDAGVELVKRCNALGILVDVSHLNAQGFRDVVRHSRAPIVATHSSAHAICPTTRNLTDDQLVAIRDSDGLVGVNFEVSATRPDGYDEPDTPIDVLVAHIEYLVERVGIERVAFGSDFDGASMPTAIGDVAGLPVLMDAVRQRGYHVESLEKLAYRSWLRVLHATWQR
ncbi:MAG: dipeptidase [Chloroflexota bacterium]|nr:dipeptidase [Chloroflexota bacterium]